MGLTSKHDSVLDAAAVGALSVGIGDRCPFTRQCQGP